MNENQLTVEYEFDKPLIQKIDSIIDNCVRENNNKYFHTFDDICEYDIQLANIGIFELVNLPF